MNHMNYFMIYLQDPCKLGTLTNEELSTLSTVPQEDLPPPPSQEDIFGKAIALKSQFQKENEKIERQLKENQVHHSLKSSNFLNFYSLPDKDGEQFARENCCPKTKKSKEESGRK